MIVTKHGFKKRYAYGGSGIFDTIANFLTRIFTSSTAKQITSSAFDLGKSVAKEGAKKALEAGKSAAVDVGKKLVMKALTPKSKKILQKIYVTSNAVYYEKYSTSRINIENGILVLKEHCRFGPQCRF